MKKLKILIIVLVVSLVLSLGVYACHGPKIFNFIGSLNTTSTYDNNPLQTLDVNLPDDKDIWVVAPITTYSATYINYTHVDPPEQVAEEYENYTIDSVVVYNAVYSFENVTFMRLDADGNGKIDVYDAGLEEDLWRYDYFLVVPIYNMGNITGETQYIPNAIIYPLDAPYECGTC